MILLFAILTLSIVQGLPTTRPTLTVRIAAPTTVHPIPTKAKVVTVTSTFPPSTTTAKESVGLRGSIENELIRLRNSYQNMRKDIDAWMNTPNHRNVVIPSMIGVLAAIITITFYHLMKVAFRSCTRRFRRYRLSRLSCEINGDKKRMLSKRGDSDDEEDI
ncbi:unnamed protein product [Strongylus vulgaris]|uniref:Uncharacterized protein n=1 Tax=Strongylus vulgaris TaxID=40348 RepID=A0A3P7J343_STRVU|nr:unnamed protein product [Strongylus vulgaris]